MATNNMNTGQCNEDAACAAESASERAVAHIDKRHSAHGRTKAPNAVFSSARKVIRRVRLRLSSTFPECP